MDKNKVNSLLDILNNPHGYAVAKVDYDRIEKGEKGKITAYLPEQNTFSVFFDDERWGTFEMTEEEFKDIFEVELL